MKRKRRKEIIYLGGPMTGLPFHNYPRFHEVAAILRKEGYKVLNPAENPGDPVTENRSFFMHLDLQHIIEADMLVFLEGWEDSAGCQLEMANAKELKKPIFFFYEKYDRLGGWGLEPIDPKVIVRAAETESIGDEAHRIVYGDRGNAYDHPAENFNRIAKIWEGIKGVEFTPEEVGLMMVGVKMSRETFRPKRDNRVDLIGYTIALERIHRRHSGVE